MPQPKSPLYDYHYFSKSKDEININGEIKQIELVKCAVGSCTISWSKFTPDRVSVTLLKSHLEHHHKEEWLQYEQLIKSASITASASST